MHTINDLVRAGMDYFTGKTVPKASLDSAVADLTAQRDAALARAEALTKDLAAANAAREASDAAAAEAGKALAAAREEVGKLAARVTDLESTKKSVAAQAAEIAAAAGHPGPVLLKPSSETPTTDEQIIAALEAIPATNGRERAEFMAKHRDRLRVIARR